MTETKKYPWYFYLLALLIPVIFFVMLELGLRLAGYGEVISQWVQPSQKFPDHLMLNPEISKRYFKNLKRVPTPHYDGFLKEKKDNTFRVFIMGGSSAAGFPYPVNGAFSRYISRYLKLQYPKAQIEVINIALSAINSYTLRDLFPGVLDQEPDLVIIYAGHNEYYGALGAGSSEFWGDATFLVNFLLSTHDIRLMQLLRDVIVGLAAIYADQNPARDDATLMERMVGEQLITLNSTTYHNGISQFRNNISHIMEESRAHDIPVIIGTVTANLRDQPPFASVVQDTLPGADIVYTQAQQAFEAQDFQTARKLFLRAKELDALRFRAPQAINTVIKDLAQQYNVPVADIDSVFRARSYRQVVGDSLMTDHLHPNLKGITLLGESIITAMEQAGYVPRDRNPAMTVRSAMDKAAVWRLTRMDSLYAQLRLDYLRGGWPFKPPGTKNVSLSRFDPQDMIEDLAFAMFTEKINWENAHVRAAMWYKANKGTEYFIAEMQAIIEVMPFNETPYQILIDGLIELQAYDHALDFLQQLHVRSPGAYSNKWQGIIYLSRGEFDSARKFLLAARAQDDRDPQLLYNLAGVHIHFKEYNLALEAVASCLEIQPDFPGAQRTLNDLKRVVPIDK